MTEFEEKKLEELRKQHEEYLNYLKQCDIERRIKEEEYKEGYRKYSLALIEILVIGFMIMLTFALPCCF